MDGICAMCGLAYAPRDRKCRQCGEDIPGRRRRLFGWLLGRDDESEPEPTRPVREPRFQPKRAAPMPEVGFARVTVSIDGETRTYSSIDDVPEPYRSRVLAAQRRSAVSGKTTYRFADADGTVRSYDSLEDLPEDLRARLDEAFALGGTANVSIESDWSDSDFTVVKGGVERHYDSLEALPDDLRRLVEDALRSGEGVERTTIRQEAKGQMYKFTDASGAEHVFDSLDEMPPEIRKLFERGQH